MGEGGVAGQGGASVVGAGPDEQLGVPIGTDLGDRPNHRGALGLVQRGRLTGGCQGDQSRHPGIEVVRGQGLQAAEVNPIPLVERGDQRDVHPAQRQRRRHHRTVIPSSAGSR